MCLLDFRPKAFPKELAVVHNKNVYFADNRVKVLLKVYLAAKSGG